MKRLHGQTAWISGATSGIGEGIARLFAEEGANVAIVDIASDRGETLATQLSSIGRSAQFFYADVSNEQQVKASLDAAAKAFGGLNIIVNNAGIVHVKQLHETSEAEWDELMGVNVKSIFLSLKHGINYLRKNERSYVVNIGSISSFVGQRGTPAYTTSKGAVLQLSKSIALDYAVDGVRCNCVCPGITDTPLFGFHINKTPNPQATLANRLRRVPMNQALTPNDIAKSVLYFSCEDSAGITGTSLVVDCGYLAAAEWDSGA